MLLRTAGAVGAIPMLSTSRCRSLQLRALATQGADKEATKPKIRAPSSIPGKAGKRAGEFFEEAMEREGDAGVTRLEKELGVLDWSVKGDSRWDIETTTPFFPISWKREQVTRRLGSLGLSPLLADLVMRLVETGDVRRLAQVRVDYEELMRTYRREVDVALVTGAPLSKEQLALMQRSIQADYLAPADNLIFAASVDPTIRGGYKLVIKGQERDLTWNRAQDEARQEQRIKRSAFLDDLQRRAPKPGPWQPLSSVHELRADKEASTIFGKELFARVLAQAEAQGSAMAAAPASQTHAH